MFELASHLYFARCATRTIFLDTSKARYFCLAPETDAAFRRWIQEPQKRPPALLNGLVQKGYLLSKAHAVRLDANRLKTPPPTREIDKHAIQPGPRVVLKACGTFLRARYAIARNGFRGALTLAEQYRRVIVAPSDIICETWVRAYRGWRAAVPLSPACLQDSLAMLLFLRSVGCPVTLVVGVSDMPFTAHCWLQMGATLLNGRLDAIASFAPILEVGP